ncbi:holin [Corynebacterium aurimucosum]|uniref:holin n=1 Tax=Corynebacterium aurimucosum TaxID=169292 RepID=UPI0018798F50|nr:holin [Corynebacterium aurimucosum]MBE7338136.1 holin [Corynebacterium aurimucosum]
MDSQQFWIDAGERALRTFAQALLASFAVGTPIWELDWEGSLGIAATAAVISVLTSVAGAGAGNPQSASFIDTGRHRAEE